MNFKHLIFASLFFLSLSCRETASEEDHGHEHGTEAGEHAHEEEAGHGHAHDEEGNHEQEEFIVEDDSLEQEKDSTHIHDDGEVHHDH